MRNRSWRLAFTLIELLIVVAIIAILAAIAVPNFLEAQMRAKVGRAKADQRTIALALESYAVDQNGKYPIHSYLPPGATAMTYLGWAHAQKQLTTPISYMNSLIADVFQLRAEQLTDSLKTSDHWIGGPYRYGSQHVMDFESRNKTFNNNNWQLRWELSYGKSTQWKLQSFGPMRDIEAYGWAVTPQEPGFPNKYYDPSNGTISRGLITRTQVYAK